MPVTAGDMLDMITGDRLPIYRATTPNISAINPFQAESGLINPKTGRKVLGIPWGLCGRDGSGGMFYYDPLELYRAGIIQNFNIKMFGDIGNQKSGGIKCYIKRGTTLGYRFLVTDRKGEYRLLASSIPGAALVQFGPDNQWFINPLDKSMDLETQTQLVSSLAMTAGNRTTPYDIIQETLLEVAIDEAHHQANEQGRDAILPDAVQCLFEPTDRMAQAMHRTTKEVEDWAYELALGTRRLTEGNMRGMFHKKTTPGLLDRTPPLTVFDCADIQGEQAVAMITLINFFTQSQWGHARPENRIHFVVHDEAWDLAAYPGFVASIRRAFKLGGTWGVANIIIAHYLSNLLRSGYDDAIKDLIADSATTILYNQNKAEAKASAEALGLTHAEVKRLPELKPGTAIFKIGSLPGIEVEQYAWPEELPLLETRGLVKGQAPQTDLPRAMAA